jgi:5-methylcytosine-specific restriction endonuclease McrA
MNRAEEFTGGIKELALARQRNVCAACGTPIFKLGEAGRANHKFGEGAHAHHIKHVKFGGTRDLSNCVILCQSCHYSAHEGGNYRFGTAICKLADFPYYRGKSG